MKVNKIMTKTVGFCRADDSLADAVKIMWEQDCGIVPVVNDKSKVIGTVTDRDVSIAVFLQNKRASDIPIAEIINGDVKTCSEKETIEDVLKKMRKNQVKRIPVVDKEEKLTGIVSITDILISAEKDKSLKKKILKTLEAIGRPRPIVLKAVEN